MVRQSVLSTYDGVRSQQKTPSEAIVFVQDLVKRYKKSSKNAVDHISFEVASGSLFAFLGPNGAGKTTSISILTTTLAPTSGTVRIAGYDLATQANEVRKHIGIVFQKPTLDLHLTAEENVRLHATLYGIYPYRMTYRMMPKAYRDQIQELAEMLGIADSLFKPVKTFSGGMKRKLEIARSLLHNPDVLFLDEPTAGLDPESRRRLWDYLREVRAQKGITIFLTTHYLEEAEGADALCILNHGHIVAKGSPQQIKDELTQSKLLLHADDRESLRAELQALGLPFVEEELFSISLANQQMHKVLKAIETPLTTVKTFTPSLEDVYLQIIRQED
uniref:ABC transporter ATP-binding protein n=1 Tax=Thermosporothrix sp. COM3 TaxID=2490863 RepID=A0A455SID1_9CHLR|nr:ABC transporter ATP-binding protein [Thermosporothrix sp. COM3]